MGDDKRDDDLAVLGRRKLMKIGLYAAPIVIGTLTISRNAAAGFSGGLCGPDSPCTPNGGICEPDNMGCMPG